MTEIDFTHIDVERTIAEFGYHPKDLGRFSTKKVVGICKMCGNHRQVQRVAVDRPCRPCSYNSKSLSENEISAKELAGISVDMTKEEFGYDPRYLKKGSNKKVIAFCIDCNAPRGKKPFDKAISHKFCTKCRHKGERNHMHGKNGEANPNFGRKTSEEVKIKISQSLQGKFVGELSPSYGRKASVETRKKMSEAHKGKPKPRSLIEKALKTKNERYGQTGYPNKGKLKWSLEQRQEMSRKRTGRKHSQEAREKMSQSNKGRKFSDEHKRRLSASGKGKRMGSKNHQYGKPARHGKGSWYTKIDGTKVWMRSTWEIKYARYLDDRNIIWEIEARGFPIIYEYKGQIKEGTYWPDFCVNGEWFEVKGYWRDDAKPKFEAFKAQYPEERITLLMKDDLIALGIELK